MATMSERLTLCRWETGASVPRLGELVRIAQYYGTSLDYIVLGKPE